MSGFLLYLGEYTHEAHLLYLEVPSIIVEYAFACIRSWI